MKRPPLVPPARQELLQPTLRFVRHAGLCFILFSLALVIKDGFPAGPTDIVVIRAAILRDLTAELPIGRQSLVSSLAVMPLPSLAALPFLPLLEPAAFGTAYLYGLALLLALASLPLRAILRQAVNAPVGDAAPFLLGLAAYALGATEWSDLLALLALLIMAVYLESRRSPEIRALAGVCWALVLLSHVAGLLLALARLAGMGLGRLRRSSDAERRAVNWIQATSILYGLGVYLFLNSMIMGSPAYPFLRSPWWRLSAADASGRVPRLEHLLTSRYSDCRPVISGVWGYAVEPLLAATEGIHVADYHASKLPVDETGSLVLVIPTGGNPYARFGDWRPDRETAALPICETTDDWTFVRIETDSFEH